MAEKKPVTHTIDETLSTKFDTYCEKNGHNKSAVVQILIENWLQAKKGK